MWPFGRFKGKVSVDASIKAGGWETLLGFPMIVGGDETWKSLSESQKEQAYCNHALVYACVRYIANTIAQAPLQVGVDSEKGFMPGRWNHWLLECFRNPNVYYSYNRLLYYVIGRLLVTGEAFVWKLRDSRGQIQELWPVPSSWVTPVAGKGTQLIASFRLQRGARKPTIIAPGDISYIWLPNLSGTFQPTGCLQAALHDYQLDLKRENFLAEMLSNLNFPGLILKQRSPMSEGQRQDLRAALKDRIGSGKRGAPIVLTGEGAEAQVVAPLADLDWPGFTALSETRICMAFGVPPILVGSRAGLERSTYSNYEQAEKTFYSDTVVPLWAMLQDAITSDFLQREGELRLVARFLLRDIQQLQEDTNALAIRLGGLFQGGLITRNEGRQPLGFSPVKGGDVYRVPINIMEETAKEAPGE